MTPPTPEELAAGLALAQKSIDRGIPAISWDLFVSEFGVIYGYDDDKKLLQAKDVKGDGTLPYAKLGRGQVGELFVMTLDESLPVDRRSMLLGALRLIVRHARTREHELELPAFENGLAGYGAWIEAFRSGGVNEFGNAYNTAVVCDARAHAVKFLQELPARWSGDSAAERTVRELAAEAKTVFEALAKMLPSFPFPQGGTPNDPETAKQAIGLLSEAREAEEAGVAVLERMLETLKA